MSDKTIPFVITDRRRHTTDGDPRPDADPSPVREAPAPSPTMPDPIAAVPEAAAPPAVPSPTEEDFAQDTQPPLTPEQSREAKLAFDATAERLDTAIRAANPGMERIPEMTFERLVQSVYMTAIMQLGGSAQEGEQPRIDLMGARQSIDMLSVLEARTKGNLLPPETQLLDNALFELRMAFLEVTQALARSAAAKGPAAAPPPSGGPRIVR